ncbi:hypothetical protein QLL95_gp0641 [Cotonvirus japonicus]|uniref:Peptidase C51 domain-containing protein n=1 Tax=Cotonvirus japonicus TaxID=2811091 RepID=A0ABM7NTI0_9VIRU|nr:hypothetical protein QLL95_gp0641 [Cotonvirus japonicus]BCS83482.1 hypothetical protein [Cotonvirus japonicus]
MEQYEPSQLTTHDKKLISQVPSQVVWARLMLKEIRKGNGETEYQHTTGPVWWGPHDSKSIYLCITDCSGFINALIKKSYNISEQEFAEWFGSERPLVSTYCKTIVEGNGFQRIFNINNIEIGDFIAIRFPASRHTGDDTGHIMLIDSEPEEIVTVNPIIDNESYYDKEYVGHANKITAILQWRIRIIDQTSTPHGKTDTRYPTNSSDSSDSSDSSNSKYSANSTGLGSGYIKIYTDTKGKFMGYSWTTSRKSKYVDKSVHPIIVGKLFI